MVESPRTQSRLESLAIANQKLRDENKVLQAKLEMAEQDWHKLEDFIAENQIDSNDLANRFLIKSYRYVDIVLAWANLRDSQCSSAEGELLIQQRRSRR